MKSSLFCHTHTISLFDGDVSLGEVKVGVQLPLGHLRLLAVPVTLPADTELLALTTTSYYGGKAVYPDFNPVSNSFPTCVKCEGQLKTTLRECFADFIMDGHT